LRRATRHGHTRGIPPVGDLCCASGSRIVHGLVFCRHKNLEQLAVVRPADDGVADAGWLHPVIDRNQITPRNVAAGNPFGACRILMALSGHANVAPRPFDTFAPP
jgi:hypothetical protein